MNDFTSASTWLITTLLSFYALVVLLRFTLQLQRISFFNPLGQMAMTLTNPVLKPLRRFIPGYKGVDLSTILLAYVICLIIVTVEYQLKLPATIAVILALKPLLGLWINIYFYALIGMVLLSWIQPFHPLQQTFAEIVQPILSPFKRMLPPMGGIDLSPFFAILAIKFVEMGLINPFIALLLQQ